MAPSFFSKLVPKNPNQGGYHSRDTSFESPGASLSNSSLSTTSHGGGKARSRTVSAVESSGSGSLVGSVGEFGTFTPEGREGAPGDRGYLSDSASSANPSVKIVPPSPSTSHSTGLGPNSRPGTADRPGTASSSKERSKSRSRPATPEPKHTLEPTAPKNKTSNKSLRSLNIPPPPSGLPQPHSSPGNETTPTHHTSNSLDGTGAVGISMTPIVESPTAMDADKAFILSPPDAEHGDGPTPTQPKSHSKSRSTSISSSGSPPPHSHHHSPPHAQHRKESTGGRSPWTRKPSSKPTGLAGAIAASGLAMANSGLSSTQHVQMHAQVQGALSPPKGSKTLPNPVPPAMNRTPSNSNISHASSPKRARRSSSGARSQIDGLPPDSNGAAYDIDYYSGLDSDSSDDDEDSSSEGAGGENGYSESEVPPARSRELSVDSLGGRSGNGELRDLPVTGFAVASSRRNAEFHELFPGIPEGDYLIEDYGCALQREILIQGRLYISENYICFHANILGWITDLSIPIYEITSLEKKMTAFVIPNAIQITTRRAKYTFASFLARDTTFDVLENVWRVVGGGGGGGSLGDGLGGGPGAGSTSRGGSIDGLGGMGDGVQGAGEVVKAAVAVAATKKHTRCACSVAGTHYPEVALDTVVPGTPDRIHNLMFASGFIKEFMSGEQKLFDIQISDWTPIPSSTPPAPSSPQPLLARNMSYIKPLSGSVGPKQTKCEIHDSVEYNDPQNYITTVTTTRTPDVPSGGVFSVKTRTCLMWESAVETRVVVSSVVEWTGRSFIKGIIERSCVEGQRTYHLDLERAMRTYIKDHQSEFIPEGIDIDVSALPSTTSPPAPSSLDIPATPGTAPLTPAKERERERNQRAFQWAWDTFAGAANVGKNSAKGAIELIRDAWDQSETTTVLYFVIVGLVLSNVYTWISASRSPAGDVGEAGSSAGKRELRELRELRRELREREGEREKWVQGIVGAVWEEMHAANTGAVGKVDAEKDLDLGDVKEAVGALRKQLEDVEAKVKVLKESLESLDSLD
ncbi:hypothetical protein VNI00_004492 [Paramarasmius palmivorus]|uniref:VASt domain-containing protein n=1 Tax=Paramarasmius palmivorus TaxID=297713 RepID=A0AAW0DJ86_9AGAR